MVFHPSHRPLEIATRFPQFHSPDDDDISPTNKKHKGTLLSSYRGGHFYWALTLLNQLLATASISVYDGCTANSGIEAVPIVNFVRVETIELNGLD